MQISGLNDNGPISPIARIKDNLSIYTAKKWSHFQIDYIEPWPRSSPLAVDMVAVAAIAIAGTTTIAANGTLAKRVLAILQVTDDEMLQVRFEPLDDVEGVVWEQSGTGKFNSKNTHARVTMTTRLRDPYLATTQFFVVGYQREMNLEVRNPNPVALNQARFQFQGIRYVMSPIIPNMDGRTDQQKIEILTRLAAGDKAAVEQFIGPTTWLPAEGR